MIELPKCMNRGPEVRNGLHACRSDRLIPFGLKWVGDDICLACPYANVANQPVKKPRIQIGELAAKREKCQQLKAAGQECHEFDPPAVIAPPTTEGVGIVVGCYQWPQLARLQIQTIREMCGNVPILIADDGSENVGDFARMCETFPNVDFQGNPFRLGHYAGDLSVFRKGVEWAAAKGLVSLVKLSQRLLLTQPGWLSAVLPLLTKVETVVPALTAGREAKLYFRTEAVAMRVSEWSTAARPKLNGDVLTHATELRFNDIIVNTFGGRHGQWPGFTIDRNARTAGTIWHATHSRDCYVGWAARYGIELEASFYTDGHNFHPGWKRG